eukprot:TRINITY_DN236_c0_g2_i1.p1 TRINITY_DN236_c0_g2~~TRINITY_DN236_c0_g2_i1.p1  ORF type:complete len:162 (-),score=43.95 TRINITY_DN236_c0_g2_i1:32-517(-)
MGPSIILIIMKYFLLILALASVASCYRADVQTVVCDLWRGWGFGFAGEVCSATVNKTCSCIFDVAPKLKEFFQTFDFSKLVDMFLDLYQVVYGTIMQFTDCKYLERFANFFTHIINFFKDFSKNFELIRVDIAGFIASLKTGDYFTAGNFLGNIFKIIFAS